MGRKIKENDIGLRLLEYVYDDEGRIICLRCGLCNKFIARDWDDFFCPHCDTSFVEGLKTEDIRCVENLIHYMEDLERLMNGEAEGY